MVAKSRARVRRPVVVDEEPEMLLQDILELPQPDQQLALIDWVDAAEHDLKNGGTVKIGTPDGKPMQIPLEGETFHIPPSGKRVDRRVALTLIRKYGLNSKHYGRDQASGMSELDYDLMAEEDRKKLFRNRTPKFNTNYLIQLPDRVVESVEDSEDNV